MLRLTTLLIAALLAFAACGDDTPSAPSTTSTPSAAAPTGQDAPAYIDSVEFIFLESYPVQVRAIVSGNLPTPCHTVGQRVGDAGADGMVTLEVFSTMADPDIVCVQVLEPFEITVDIGDFETGDYLLVVDGVDYPFTI